jgi:WD40 repeat protein
MFGSNGEVTLWEVATGKRFRTLRTDKPHGLHNYQSITFSRDGRLVAALSWAGTVVWEVASGKEVLHVHPHGEHASAAALGPDGRRLATGGKDGVLEVWDTTTGRNLLTLLPGRLPPVESLAFSRNGRYLAAGCGDSTVRVFDAGPAAGRR